MTLRNTLLASAFGLMIASFGDIAHASESIIALSPNGNSADKKAEVIDALKLATQSTNPGETTHFMNGLMGKSICDFKVPDRKSYSSDKAKISANKSCAGKLMKFANEADTSGYAGALDISGSFRSIIETYDLTNIDAIVLLGSPLSDGNGDPRISMRGGHVPNDDHITATQIQSHYGLNGYRGALDGISIHLSSDGYEWSQGTAHEEAIKRFHALSADHLGGAFVTHNEDHRQLIERVKRGVNQTVRRYELVTADKLEMLYVGKVATDHVPIHERDVSIDKLPPYATRDVRGLEVGITWFCACDIDLYVRPNDRAEVLYFGRQRTREGMFFKDYRHSADLKNGLETVQLDAPTDLSDMDIGINFYSGASSEGVTGEIRLSLGGQTYARSFAMAAKSGNGANGAAALFDTGEAPSDHWVAINGLDIVDDYLDRAAE